MNLIILKTTTYTLLSYFVIIGVTAVVASINSEALDWGKILLDGIWIRIALTAFFATHEWFYVKLYKSKNK